MSNPLNDIIQDNITEIRENPEFHRLIKEIKGELNSALYVREWNDLSENFKSKIAKVLTVLGEKHLAKYWQECKGKMKDEVSDVCFALISYTSIVRTFSDESSIRVPNHPDYLTIPLTRINASIKKNLDMVLKKYWKEKILPKKNHIEIHKVAQLKYRFEAQGEKHLFIYVNSTSHGKLPETELWERFIITDSFLYDHEKKSPDAAVFFFPENKEELPLKLHSFFQQLQKHIDISDSVITGIPQQGQENEPYRDYADYIGRLLSGPSSNHDIKSESLCLCTIAVTDELSDIPLGTVMLFTDRIVPPGVAIGLHDLCFELFDALHKLESDIQQRHKTAWLLSNWTDHELAHWHMDAERIAGRLDECECPSKNNNIRELAQELRDLAIEVKRCGQLFALYQEQGVNIDSEEFRKEIEAVLRKRTKAIGRSKDSYELSIELPEWGRIPAVLLPVTVELIRNAFRHSSAVIIKVSYEKKNGNIVLSVSSPIKKKSDYSQIKSILTENYIPESSTKPHGLWLIKTILRPQGGRITVCPRSENEINEKSMLTIKIEVPFKGR
jgi:hypothetical protein